MTLNIDKYIPIVRQVGLSKNEALIYLTLLELGEISMTTLSIKTNLARPSAYNFIEELQMKGLVSRVERGKRHYYSAVHPKKLKQMIDYKKNQIDNYLPELLGIYSKKIKKPKIQMFEGIEGVVQMYQNIFNNLGNGDELLIFTNIGRVNKLFPEIPQILAKKTSALSFKSKIRELVFDDEAGREHYEKMKSRLGASYEMRFNNSIELGDNEQFILNDRIVFFSLSKEIYIINIESGDLAKTQKAMFELAWTTANKESKFKK